MNVINSNKRFFTQTRVVHRHPFQNLDTDKLSLGLLVKFIRNILFSA